MPPGTVGTRLLVTVLFARPLPLIRYELSDRVALAERRCPCGRSFRQLAAVEGRQEDVLELPTTSGRTQVHPNVFHRVLDEVSGAGGKSSSTLAGCRCSRWAWHRDIPPSR
ncbi:hypothetical protein KFL01_29370 [Kocuria flava]|uniref:AMP-dependent ligase C-terminal domain-containing protein n=1 Tax=Kocuria flava TaxID=446860 RepID=A0ABQ0X7N0_9MICC|nr:hypothetical protein KFL01_29370 [Kocuria flava]